MNRWPSVDVSVALASDTGVPPLVSVRSPTPKPVTGLENVIATLPTGVADVPGDDGVIVVVAAVDVAANDLELKNTAPVVPPMLATLPLKYCCEQ